MKIKPGYKTSEFWFTLVSFIFSGLFLLGIIGDYDQKEELISNVSHAVESVILIGGQLVILKKYLDARKLEKIEIQKRKQRELETQNKELEDYVGVGKSNDIININTASIGELIQLPHIGPALAKKILDRRTDRPFDSIEEICEIDGIGADSYEEIKQYITVKGKSDEPKRTTKTKSRKSNTRKQNRSE
jgi:competence ComEA-like helix-hairpin-helix protein